LPWSPSFAPTKYQGLGSALIRTGLAECRRLGIPWVVLVGHETYYLKLGFDPASRWNLIATTAATPPSSFTPPAVIHLNAR
jgi:predicted N-acetyltransferase YhbS